MGWSNIFALILGVTGLLISWAIRPRIPNIPKGVLPKEEFPALYEFTDSIADSLNAKRVDGIIISGDLNAAFGQYGIGSKKIIHIGLPLWEILSIEEKSALIAHELSHGINGDPLRGLFIENALQSLLNWFVILRPSGFWEPEKGVLGILILPLNLLLWIPAGFVLFMAYLLAYLIYADSQRSEYFADYLATRACGTEAMVSLLEKSLIAGKRFEMILHKVFLGRKAGDLFEELTKDIFSLSQEEKEKIKKIGQLEKSRLDATHPPTFYRIQFLKHHFEAGTLILPGVDKIALLEREMSILKSDAQAEIINIYEATLYY